MTSVPVRTNPELRPSRLFKSMWRYMKRSSSVILRAFAMYLSLIHIYTVVHLLENREYTGCLVNFKTEKPYYKTKQSVENPIEKQAIFPNHHEPIIDTETWERVQELRKQRKRPNRYDEVGLFSGMLFCADCGHVMYQQRYQNKTCLLYTSRCV